MIPVVGGLVAELGACLASPLEKRKADWAQEVENALKELAERHARLPVALAEDPAFVSFLLKATTAALATHRKEKRKALRSFLVAVGSYAIPDEELQHAVLKLIDDLSVGHLEVLRFLDREYNTIATKQDLESIYEYYRESGGHLDRSAFRWILADLSVRMAIHLADLDDMNEFVSQKVIRITSESRIRPLQITILGRQLLQLLKESD